MTRSPGARFLVICLTLASAAGGASGCLRGDERGPCDPTGPVGTVCGFSNPEDVEYIESAGLVLVTNMRGRGGEASGRAGEKTGESELAEGGFIAGWVPDSAEVVRLWPSDREPPAERSSDVAPALGDPSCTEPPQPGEFRPHGMTSEVLDERTVVFVTAHAGRGGGREAVEVFALAGRGIDASLTWIGCIPTPGAIQANDVSVTRDGTVVVSNYQPDDSLLHTIKASFLGTATGDVVAWSAASGWRHVGATRAGLANGVAISGDGRMLFFAESISGLLHRLPLDGGGGAVSIDVGGNPDNLSWTKNGRLLIATHTGGRAFALCLLGRRPCTTSWEILEVDPMTLAIRRIIAHDGELLGAVSSAVQVGDRLVLGSVFDDRIGIVDLTQPRQHAKRP